MTGSSILSIPTSAKRWSRPASGGPVGQRFRWIVVKTLVVEAPHAQVDDRSSHPARLIGSHEDRHVGHLSERRKPSRVGPAGDHLLELFPRNSPGLGVKPEDFLDRARLRHPLWSQTDHANALRCEFG